jgi:hypothetical protein
LPLDRLLGLSANSTAVECRSRNIRADEVVLNAVEFAFDGTFPSPVRDWDR